MLGDDVTLSGDHPRIRGEHRQEGRKQGLVWGSSPHTRGAPWTFKTA